MWRALAVLLLVAPVAHAQDVLSLGSVTASAGGSAQVPVTVLDRTGTILGSDSGTGKRIQAIAFKVLFPSGSVAGISFTRGGVLASLSPIHESSLQGDGYFAYLVSFAETGQAIAFPPNSAVSIGTLQVTASATASGSFTLRLDPGSAMLANQAGTSRETVSSGTLALVNGVVTISAVAVPANVVAVASGTSAVNVTWSAVGGATHYEVWRSSGNAPFIPVASPAGTSFGDTGLASTTTYLYRVRAVDGGEMSGFSSTDAATTIVFTEDPVVAQVTSVRAIHVTELASAVNAMRTAAGLATAAADPTVGAGLTVRATHVSWLRSSLNEARTAIGMAALSYTDPALSTIRAIHVTELRNGVR